MALLVTAVVFACICSLSVVVAAALTTTVLDYCLNSRPHIACTDKVDALFSHAKILTTYCTIIVPSVL